MNTTTEDTTVFIDLEIGERVEPAALAQLVADLDDAPEAVTVRVQHEGLTVTRTVATDALASGIGTQLGTLGAHVVCHHDGAFEVHGIKAPELPE